MVFPSDFPLFFLLSFSHRLFCSMHWRLLCQLFFRSPILISFSAFFAQFSLHRLMWMCYLFSAMQWHFAFRFRKRSLLLYDWVARARSPLNELPVYFPFAWLLLSPNYTLGLNELYWKVNDPRDESSMPINGKPLSTHNWKLNEMDDWIFTKMSSHYSLEINIFQQWSLFLHLWQMQWRPKLFGLFTNRFLRNLKLQTGEMTFKMKQIAANDFENDDDDLMIMMNIQVHYMKVKSMETSSSD